MGAVAEAVLVFIQVRYGHPLHSAAATSAGEVLLRILRDAGIHQRHGHASAGEACEPGIGSPYREGICCRQGVRVRAAANGGGGYRGVQADPLHVSLASQSVHDIGRYLYIDGRYDVELPLHDAARFTNERQQVVRCAVVLDNQRHRLARMLLCPHRNGAVNRQR